MRKVVMGATVAGLLALPVQAHGARHSPEGCQAQNPLQPTCSYTVTHTSATPITGVAGAGSWVVKVKRGKQTVVYKSPADGAPTALEIAFQVGDKVTAQALSPGSGLTVGHADP